MPTVADEFVPLRTTFARPDVAAGEEPGYLDTLKAAGTVANWPYRAWRYFDNRAKVEADPDYDPFSQIKGTKYDADPQRFAFSRDASETSAIMREWDEDESARGVLAKSGWSGTVASIGMGLIDPTIVLPVAKVFSGAAAGYSALRIGADVALTGGATAAIGEGVMYGTTPDYTMGDVAAGVGSATVLSGLLGTAFGAFLSRPERDALSTAFDVDRADWGSSVSTSPQAAGAAATDTRALELRRVPGMGRVPDITAKVSPPRRVLNSGFLSGRRAVADLVETPYIFEDNVQGVATTQGPALSRQVQLETAKGRVAMAETFDDLYSRYRTGGSEKFLQKKSRQTRDLVRGPEDGALTFPQFKEKVDEALRNGDESDIAEVTEAARFMREKVLAPWRDQAIEQGLLPEGVDAKTADSYMMRVWNKERIVADRPAVVRLFGDWLDGQEAKKAQLQQSLTDHRGLLDDYSAKIAKLEQKLAKRTAQLETLGAQRGETTGLNRFSYVRSGKVRDQLQDLKDALPLRGVDNETSIAAARNNARGGAVFETKIRGRSNQLADRMSGISGEVDDLQRRLADMTARRDSVRGRIEETISTWEGKSAAEAKGALKARAANEAARPADKTGRLKEADGAVDAAVERILSKERIRDRQELDDLANEIIERILGNPDGRLPYDRASASNGGSASPAMRGPLAARDFMIPDNLILDYLERDAQHVGEMYLNTMVPDVLLTKRFGDVDMSETFRKLQDEHVARASSAKTPAERERIKKEYDAVVSDIAAMRDRVRHTYGYSSDPRQRFLGRMAATAARFDIVTNLGGAALSSLSDLAGLQWRYGFATTFKHAWAPMLKALTNPETRKMLKAQKSQLRSLGIAAETYLNTRTTGMYDVLDVYKPTSRFERGMNVMADKFGLANLLTPWTDFGKFAAGMVSGAEISRAVEALALGKAKPRQIRDLAEGGIDAVMAGRIWKQLSGEGGADVIDGTRIPNTGNWTDGGAREAFEGMLARDVDLMILTPGAEKPLMMSNPIWALILQYKTFVTAANERILIRSLQARDGQVLQGLGSAIVLGALAEYAYTGITGRKEPETPSDWIKAGISRSGVLGWYQEGNAALAKATYGKLDAFRAIGANQPEARYLSRSPLSAFAGPVFGKFETTVNVFGKLIGKAFGADADWNANDTTQLRRLLPAQNLFYLRRLLDEGEDVGNEWLGVEPKDRNR